MNNKLRIAISPSEEMWNKEDFRDLIREIVEDEENTELYIITDSTDTEFIEYINETTELESDHIFQLSDIVTITAKLIELNVLLYLCDTYRYVNYINNSNPISLVQGNITGTHAILVNSLQDTNKLQPIYITQLNFWTDQIKKYK